MSDHEQNIRYTDKNPQIGLSVEKLLIFADGPEEINIFNLTWSSYYWEYRESYESYCENGYAVLEDEDGSTGLGLYCGVGITSFSLGEILLGMECTSGIIFLPPYTDAGFDNLLSNMYYLRFRLFINYASY